MKWIVTINYTRKDTGILCYSAAVIVTAEDGVKANAIAEKIFRLKYDSADIEIFNLYACPM